MFSESFDNQSFKAWTSKVDADTFLEIGDYSDEDQKLRKYFICNDMQKEAIQAYTNQSTINLDILKGKLTKSNKILYEELTNLPSIPLKETHHVYCGTGKFNPQLATFNDEFRTPIFMSTSLNIDVAIKTDVFRTDDDDFVMHIELKDGFKAGFYIAPYSIYPEELEYLLFPQTPLLLNTIDTANIGGRNRTILNFCA